MSDATLTVEAPAVTLTPSAIRRVQFLIEKQGKSDLALRIGVKGGGCSGLSYTMSLDAQATDRDFVFEQDGVRILVDKKSARFLNGVQLDFSTGNLLEGGWVWSNPNAGRSCGCGTSFTPK
jgi:iron-sulfur cluster assembly protein